MVGRTNEQALEAAIEKALTGSCLEERSRVAEGQAVTFSRSHGYRFGLAGDFNAHYALDRRLFWQFLEQTQIAELEKLRKRGDDWQPRLVAAADSLRRLAVNRRSKSLLADIARVEAAKVDLDNNLNIGLCMAVLGQDLIAHVQQDHETTGRRQPAT